MTHITSLNNDRVRRVQALLRSTRRRAREGLMVAEGLRLVREAALAQVPLTWCFYTADFVESVRGAALLERLRTRDVELCEVTPEVMVALTDTETPQGVVAVLPIPALEPQDSSGLTLIPDRIRDPGNLGTILRSAWAAGVRRVLLPPGTVDPTNPKVVRSGMGAHFHVPLQRLSWEEVGTQVADGAVWLAESAGGTPYHAVDWAQAAALIIGGEAEGAGAEAHALAAGQHVYIPMAAGVESLNAAIAASVLLFEARRQRFPAD